MPEHVHVEQRGGVALVRIDRPPANAFHPGMVPDFEAALEEVRRAEAGAVVLTGREGFFSAGVDLKALPQLDAAGQGEMVMGINRLLAAWYGFPRPVVSAVNGHAIAGGLVLALCGDYRVGPAEGRFGLTELRVGVPFPAVAMAIVKAELTPPVARLLCLRSGLIGPREALAQGLFDELAAPEAVLPRALEVGDELAALPRRAYEVVKRQARAETVAEAARRVEEQGDPLGQAWLGPETAGAAAAALRRG